MMALGFVQKSFVAVVDNEDSDKVLGLLVDVGGPDTVCGVFRWVPNFRQWIRDVTSDDDMSRITPANTYVDVTPSSAAQLVEDLPKLDGRSFGWVLREFEQETDRLSCADLGLDVATKEKRPTSDQMLLDAVRKAPVGTWVSMRRFPANKSEAARKWVSDVRRGRQKRLALFGPLDAVIVRQSDGVIEALVRRTVLEGEELLGVARRLAAAAHGRQLDKSGHAYIDHPRRVAERLQAAGEPDEVVAAGWLHDVLEDTTMTADDLIGAGIPDRVVAAVDAVSKRPGESLEDYAERVKASDVGLRVKLADLADNTDPERVAMLDDQTRDRLAAKYERMCALLGVLVAA